MRFLVLPALLLAALGMAFLFGAYTYKHRATLISFLDRNKEKDRTSETTFASTSLYDVEIKKIATPAKGRDGGIAALDGGILIADWKGQLWFVDGNDAIQPLTLRIPVNRDAFESDPDNAEISYKSRFSVKDILVDRFSDQLMLIASYMNWDQNNDCQTLRVSYTITTNDVLEGRDNHARNVWRTVFDSTPCLPLRRRYRGSSPISCGRRSNYPCVQQPNIAVCGQFRQLRSWIRQLSTGTG